MGWNKNMVLLFAIIALALSIAFFAWVYNLSLPEQATRGTGKSQNVGKVVLNVVGTPTPNTEELSPEQVCNSLSPRVKQDCLDSLANGGTAATQEEACKLLPVDLQQDCLNSIQK